MAQVLHFSAAVSRRRVISREETIRSTMHALLNDLQLLALDRPMALKVIARITHQQAVRVRRSAK